MIHVCGVGRVGRLAAIFMTTMGPLLCFARRELLLRRSEVIITRLPEASVVHHCWALAEQLGLSFEHSEPP